jgi:hypothetical protein
LLTLTDFERAIRRALINRARDANGSPENALIEYGELAEVLLPFHRDGDPALQWPFGGFFEALGHVSMFEVEHGRPMLTAVVVSQDTREPGEGFTKLAKHLGFQVDGDGEEFWAQEVAEVLEVWRADAATGALDAAIELLDERMRGIQRTLRRSQRDPQGPYVARTLVNPLSRNATPMEVAVTNVGDRPAVDAMYIGWLPSGMVRTDVFHLAPGPSVKLKLFRGGPTYDPSVMGHQVDEVAEVIIFGDGNGRWTRLRPQLSQKPESWAEGDLAEPDWITWYRQVRRGLALESARVTQGSRS